MVGNGRDIGLFLHPVRSWWTRATAILGKWAMRAASPGSRTPTSTGRKKAPPGGRKKREAERRRPRADRDLRGIRRWIGGLRGGADLALQEAAMVTLIDDREGDIYGGNTPRPARLTSICSGGAPITTASCAACSKLFAAMAAATTRRGAANLHPCEGAGRPARIAKTRVSWREDRNPAAALGLSSQTAAAVGQTPRGSGSKRSIRPEGVEPILWISGRRMRWRASKTALRIVSWYRARWTIEQVFRTT